MRLMRLQLLHLLTILLLVNTVNAINVTNTVYLHGTIFNADLQPVNAIVELDNPKQVFVATNGTYSFNVKPNTNYTLKASTQTLEETEEINIGDQDVQFDVVLLSSIGLDNGVQDINETIDAISGDYSSETLQDEITSPNLTIIGIGIAIVAIILAIGTYLLYKKRNRKTNAKTKPPQPKAIIVETKIPQVSQAKLANNPPLDSFKQELLKLIKENDGAVEQKELRKELPWSEARVSIELSELEKMGLIKRIKRGRANLVKLI